MSIAPALQLPEPPDLMRRFVATPFEACMEIGGMRVLVQTNDSSLLEELGSTRGPCLDADWTWTVVGDAELPAQLGEATIIENGAMVFFGFGRACQVVLDREKRELTGFVSNGVLNDEWVKVIGPMVLMLFGECCPREELGLSG